MLLFIYACKDSSIPRLICIVGSQDIFECISTQIHLFIHVQHHLFMHPFPCRLMSWGPCFSVVISLPPCTVPVNAEQVHLGESEKAGAENQTKPEQGFLSH